MKIFMNIRNILKDPARTLQEKVFVALTLAALGMAVTALLGDIIYGENIVEIIVLAITVVLTPFATYWAIMNKKIDLTVRIISGWVILVIMPLIFIFGGGVQGGSISWLIFTYLYVGLMLSGAWRTVTLLAHTVVVISLFTLGYYRPEMIVPHTRSVFYIDLTLSIIEVGLVCYIMTWFQSILFNQENERAKEETRKFEELNRSQNRFFSSMSHEIRTPINSILGLNEIILRQEDASEEIKKDARNIHGAGKMLLSLINDILDFSKIEAGKMDIVPVNYNMASMISEIVNMMWMRAEQKGLELKIEVDPSIPSELYGDEVRIKQILINLLNNAIKYTREGSVTLHIEKEEVHEDQVILAFSVTDTGMGIKQDALPYLFDAFQRVDEQQNLRIEGTGLGLSIVKQLVDMMGGRITVNSIYTQGSTFIVTLWQKVSRFDAIGEINLTGTGTTGTEEKYRPDFRAPEARILIVDDNILNLEVEKKLLDETQILIDTAMSGDEALSMTLLNSYDLILMDHLMPGMDGIECMQQIRKQQGGLSNRSPIIVLTANAGSENKALYTRSGFEGYLVKPVSGKQLEEMIIRHIPEQKIIRNEMSDPARLQMNTAKGYSRKIPLLIATSSLCDLPISTVREYQINVIPFTIIAEGKTYLDGVEAGADELLRYMRNGMNFSAVAPTVEEYEKFFGDCLKKAHNIIYISAARNISVDYGHARQAAKTYENVRIIDSGLNTSALGLVVMLAQKMTLRGETEENIINELKKLSKRIRLSFITDGSYFLTKKESFDQGVVSFIRTLRVHPFVKYKNGNYSVNRLSFGENEKSYIKFIDYSLPKMANPDDDIMFVIYSDQTEKEIGLIRERIKKHFDFKHLVFQKGCSVLAYHCGPGAFGLVYISGNGPSYELSDMIISNDDVDDDNADYTEDYAQNAVEYDIPQSEEIDIPLIGDGSFMQLNFEKENETKAESEPEWYEGIVGISRQDAINNSGSEESLRIVLKIYYESIDESVAELDGYYDAKDWSNYTIKIHALKSSSRLIGANDLADACLALENAGDEKDIDYIDKHHNETMDALKAYRKPLGRLFGEDEADDAGEDATDIVSEDKDSKVSEDFDRYLIESVYEAIRDGAIARDDAMITDTLMEIEDYELLEADQAKIDAIKECLKKKDHVAMIEILDS